MRKCWKLVALALVVSAASCKKCRRLELAVVNMHAAKSRVSRLSRALACDDELPAVAYFLEWEQREGRDERALQGLEHDLSCESGECSLTGDVLRMEQRYGICDPSTMSRDVRKGSNAFDAYGMPVLGTDADSKTPLEGCSMLHVGGGFLLAEMHCVQTVLCGNRAVEHRALFGFDVRTLASGGKIRSLGIEPEGTERPPWDSRDPCGTPSPATSATSATSAASRRVGKRVNPCDGMIFSNGKPSAEGLALVKMRGGMTTIPTGGAFGCRAPKEGEPVYSLGYPDGGPLMRAYGGVVESVGGGGVEVRGLLHRRQSSSSPIFSADDGALVGVANGSAERTMYCSVDGMSCAAEIGCGSKCGVVHAIAMSSEICGWYAEKVRESENGNERKRK